MTAEDAGAGVQAGTLVLTVRPEGAAPVPLPLHEAEPLIGDWSGQPAVEAGVPMSLEVSGLPPRAAVTVRMGGEVLAGDQYREEDCVHLELQDPLPFDNMIGVAKLEVLVSMGPQACSFFYAEPLRIILKPGLASDNLLRMSESVAEHVERLFGGDAVRTGDDSLGDLLGVLERLSSLYERQYPYFREDPKCRLASTARRMSIERMRDMTPEAARWMASHPHEWQRVAPGHGIRMRGANWMPAHALVRTSELSRDLYENRVVAGFPLHLASETRRLAQAFEDAVRVGAGPLDAGTIGRMAAVRIVSSEADVLRGYGIVFSRIAELYRDALGVWTYDSAWLDAHVPDIADTRELRVGYKLGTVDEQMLELAPEEVKASRRRLLDSAKLPNDADAVRVRQAAAKLHRGLRPTAAEFAEDRKTAAAKEAARLITAEKVPSATERTEV